MKALRDPLLWLSAMFIALLLALPYSAPLFSALFPELPRPVYQQESFVSLTLAHFWLVALSSLAATIVGVGAGIAVTRPGGDEFRPLVETIAAMGQTFPAGRGAGDCGSGDGVWLAARAYRAGAVWHIAGFAGHAGRDWGGTVRGVNYRAGDGDERLAEADEG